MKTIALAIAIASCWIAPSIAADVASRPNIILILADDLGYSDIGCYGGEIDTPALDQLAAGGMRLSRVYNGGMCVVTRASLLTGRWWPSALPRFSSCELLPEKLHDAGYRTGLIGKWHLDGHPMDHGFDHFFGFLNGFTDHFAGSATYRLDREPFNDFGPDYYSSDAFSDRAIDFIQRSSGDAGDRPFMLYLSYQAPHNPLQAPAADIARHRGHYQDGWHAIRQRRIERQRQLGLLADDTTVPAPPQNLPRWESLSNQQRDLEDRRMAVYAAMVQRMDVGIGRVMNALRQTRQDDNTIVLFLSDNGTDSFSVVDEAMIDRGKLPGDPASNWQPGTGWAYASVTPWRLYKISQHGGGVTTGGIVHWPDAISTTGQISTQPIHVVDIMPTLLEAAGMDPNESQRDASDRTEDVAGVSWLDLLNDSTWQRGEPLFFQYMDNRAIRTPRWTLVEVDGSGWELFDVMADPLETHDLAGKFPDVVQDLASQWDDWWIRESGESHYKPKSTRTSPHYAPQGDRGSGKMYVPTAMPPKAMPPKAMPAASTAR